MLHIFSTLHVASHSEGEMKSIAEELHKIFEKQISFKFHFNTFFIRHECPNVHCSHTNT